MLKMTEDNGTDVWFKFVEEYNKLSTVPLSWTLIGGGQKTGIRMVGSPLAMTTLSKSEWNKITNGS